MNIHLVQHLNFVMRPTVTAHSFLWIFAKITQDRNGANPEIIFGSRGVVPGHMDSLLSQVAPSRGFTKTTMLRGCSSSYLSILNTSIPALVALQKPRVHMWEEDTRDTLCRRRIELPVPGALAEGGVLTHDARVLNAVTLYSSRGPGLDIFSFSTLT